MEAIIIRHY